ncbi:MAG: hypothetical protein K2P78_08130 [Gemmataceae bacterium]|nr:hypothetical protein [Gemmataceae bacterium]
MSTTLPPNTSAPPGAHMDVTAPQKIDYLIVYGHSNILYWWPVWLMAFVLAAVTYVDGHQMAVVPDGTVVERGRAVEGVPGRHDVLVAPEGKQFRLAQEEGQTSPAGMTVSGSNGLGVIFVATLVVVALASTILLRGLVSAIALIVLVTVAIGFELLGWWNDILWFVGGLDIRMNAAGYLAIAIPLFLVWLAVVFLYDRATYIIFDQGQIRYVHEVGDAEVTHQSEGAIVEKKRNDVFRHWLLGFGTGDLVIRLGGANGQAVELENVIGINRKLALIQRLVKEKAITVEA